MLLKAEDSVRYKPIIFLNAGHSPWFLYLDLSDPSEHLNQLGSFVSSFENHEQEQLVYLCRKNKKS